VLKMLSTYIYPTAGRITIDGLDVRDHALIAHLEAQARLRRGEELAQELGKDRLVYAQYTFCPQAIDKVERGPMADALVSLCPGIGLRLFRHQVLAVEHVHDEVRPTEELDVNRLLRERSSRDDDLWTPTTHTLSVFVFQLQQKLQARQHTHELRNLINFAAQVCQTKSHVSRNRWMVCTLLVMLENA